MTTNNQQNDPTDPTAALTIEDIQNAIAFGNRAQMAGKEADTWFFLKGRLAHKCEQLMEAKKKGAPDLKSVDGK